LKVGELGADNDKEYFVHDESVTESTGVVGRASREQRSERRRRTDALLTACTDSGDVYLK
jgi:hypothetical protein